MSEDFEKPRFQSARDKFLGLSLESTRKSYYPQLKAQLDAARENERRLQLLIDALPALISYTDAEQRFILVNRQYERSFGRGRDQIVGQTMRAVIGEDNYARCLPHLQQALAGKPVQFEMFVILPDGAKMWIESSYVPVLDKTGAVAGVYTLCRDTTEKKEAEQQRIKLEEKLREADKLKALGTLAGGIAHDFNNLLMGIQGRASLMAMDVQRCQWLKEHVEAIEQHVRSAADLTRQLLGLARGGKYETKPTDLNELVLKTAKMFGRTRKEIETHLHLHPAPLVVEADRGQIEQVVLNMLVNAWQAMPDGGAIDLQTDVAAPAASVRAAHDIGPGPFARISITDTGCGMNEETRQRVFDPFFTTKEKQRGTGLGLASAYGIVKNHGGIITVFSEIGQGTTFHIHLPLSEKKALAQQAPVEEIHRGSGTILLVDDEQMILDVGQAMLKSLGYRTTGAKGGKEALALLESPENDFDLVILDLIMPGFDGGKTFDRIRALRPTLPVILSSGYSLDGQAQEILARGCDGFIQKPFHIKELSRILQDVLARDGRDRTAQT